MTPVFAGVTTVVVGVRASTLPRERVETRLDVVRGVVLRARVVTLASLRPVLVGVLVTRSRGEYRLVTLLLGLLRVPVATSRVARASLRPVLVGVRVSRVVVAGFRAGPRAVVVRDTVVAVRRVTRLVLLLFGLRVSAEGRPTRRVMELPGLVRLE